QGKSSDLRREQLRCNVLEICRAPRAVVIKGEYSPNASAFWPEEISEHVYPLQRRDGSAAIDVAARNALPGRVRVVEDRIDAAGRSRPADADGWRGDCSFAQPPFVIRRAAARCRCRGWRWRWGWC